MTHRTQQRPPTPHALQAVEYGGRGWFIDGRLGEFRRVDAPWIVIDFDTPIGHRMLRELDVAVCECCGRAAMTMELALASRARCHVCGWPMLPA